MPTKKIAYESWVASFIERLSDYFNLAGWVFEIEYEKKPSQEMDGAVYAKIEVNSIYLHAHLTIYPIGKEDFTKGNMERLVRSLVHELVHVFLDPFQDAMHPHLSITTTPLFMTVIEQQTQKLTMVLLKTLPKDVIPPR